MCYGLKEESIKKIVAVFASYPQVEQVVLYGSRAKGNFKNGSDIDLTLKGQDLSQSIVWTIRSALDDLSIPYTVDVSFFDDLSDPALLDHIQRVGVVFYQKS